MNKEQHKYEIDQVKKHVKMLNITGGIAICALTLAGILMVSDTFNAPAENIEISASNQNVSPESSTVVESSNKSTIQHSDISITENAVIETISLSDASSAHVEKATARKHITFEEELQSFDASCNDGSILFQWVTSGGSKYAYEVEKSYDQVNYEVFSRAPQPEKKDGKNIYALEETATVGDDAFYRLRKVVGKGKYEYSESVKVKCATAEAHAPTIDVFPNGNGSFRIMINTTEAGAYKVTLTDVNETALATEQYMAKEGNNEFILSTKDIIRGNYVLRVSNDSMVKERKVVLK